MPEEIDDLDLEPTEDDDDEAGGGDKQEEPRLYAGKYKTVEEMEAAYQESQSAMTKAQQRAAELERGGYQQPQPPTQPADFAEQFNNMFYENPVQAVGMILQNYDAYRNNVEASIESAEAQFEADAVYKEVQKSYRAALKKNAARLSDPTTAAQVADELYNQVVGEHFRKSLTTVKEDPAKRANSLRQTGLESAQPSSGANLRDGVSRGDMSVLDQLGLGADGKKGALKRYNAMLQEED